jgi:hypothetical protein
MLCVASLAVPVAAIAYAHGNNGNGVPPAAAQPVTVQGKPFGATNLDLARFGYVEEEYYISGKANRYRIPAANSPNPLGTAQVIDGGYPYVSRILVRRPARAKDFNGVVLVEWYNVTVGQDIDFTFSAMYEHMLREGYAFVAVSAQRVGINTLRTVNSARYSSLTAEASNVDPVTGGIIDPGGGVNGGGDVLSWDIYGQTAALLRERPSRVLGDLKPKTILALGESQSAGRLTTYYNAIQPLHRLYEGFLTYDRAGRLRTDTGVKSISVTTETFPGVLAPDSNDHRWYEVAGASHVSLHDANYVDPIVKRDGVLRNPSGQPLTLTEVVVASGCLYSPLWSRVPTGHVLNAGLEHLVKWIKTGKAPPKAERLVRGATGVVARDAAGRVTGGVRLSAYDSPIADNAGGNNPGGTFCPIGGYHFDYLDNKLCDLYGSQQRYVQKVEDVTERAQRAGFVLQTDAEETEKDAKRFDFPNRCSRHDSHVAAH